MFIDIEFTVTSILKLSLTFTTNAEYQYILPFTCIQSTFSAWCQFQGHSLLGLLNRTKTYLKLWETIQNVSWKRCILQTFLDSLKKKKKQQCMCFCHLSYLLFSEIQINYIYRSKSKLIMECKIGQVKINSTKKIMVIEMSKSYFVLLLQHNICMALHICFTFPSEGKIILHLLNDIINHITKHSLFKLQYK